MRVLLVEDDEMLGAAVRQALLDASYAADWVTSGDAAAQALATHAFDLVVLDLGLPGRDGLDVLQSLRGRKDTTPVLVVTARDTVDQRIAGLDHGADDYLGKPFAVGELLARLRALVRRRAGAATPTLSNGVLSLELATKRVVSDGQEALLSNREFALLQALMMRPGAVLSRAQIEDAIYGWGEEVESNAVDVIIHGLRKKIGVDKIMNVRGLGWMVRQNVRAR